MEDVRIGRATGRRSTSVAVATTKGELVPYVPGRYTLIISGPLTNDLWLSWNVADAAGVGLRIPPGSLPFRLEIASDGALAEGPIYANVSVAGETISYAESILEQR